MEAEAKIGDIINLLKQEIKWCNNHKDRFDGKEIEWFIKGLEQAKALIIKYNITCLTHEE